MNFAKSTPQVFRISKIICGEIWSGLSGNGGESVSKLIWVLLGGEECGPVYLCTQPFLFQKHLQYKLSSNNKIMITIIGVPIIINFGVWSIKT